MRKLLTVSLAALFAGAALVACDRLPQQPADTQEVEVKASQGPAQSGITASQEAGQSGMQVENTWGNDHLWRFLIPHSVPARLFNSEGVDVFGLPANEASLKPLYEIGPDAGDDGVQGDEGFSPHDHVVPVPPQNGGSYTANWHFKAVVAAPGGNVATSGDPLVIPGVGTFDLAHAADVDADPELEDLTSAEKVQEAADRGHVIILSSELTFVCPVKDIEG